VPHGHESDDNGYGNAAYQPPSSAKGPSSDQDHVYKKPAPQSYDQANGRRHDSQESDDEGSGAGAGSTFILRDSRGRTLSLPKSSGTSLGGANSWTGGGGGGGGNQDEPAHTGKRYH